MKKMTKTASDVANFLSGIFWQELFKNGCADGLGHKVIPKGVEHSSASFNLDLRNKFSHSQDQETRENALYLRHEPDAITISPEGKIKFLQIRSRYCFRTTIEEILSDNFEMNDFKEDQKLYPTVRYVFLDTSNYMIRSLSSSSPLTIEGQHDNWYKPWVWIDGLRDQDHYHHWIEFYFKKPMEIFSSRTSSNLMQQKEPVS